MVKIHMSIELDDSKTSLEIEEKCVEYNTLNLKNVFEKFCKSVGGDKLWRDIVHDLRAEDDNRAITFEELANM